MSNEIIFLSNVRLSFPHLTEPHAAGNDPNAVKKYSADLLMPQDHPGFAEFMQRAGELSLAQWGEHSGAVMQMIQQDRRQRCYGNGAEKINKKTMQPYDGYKDMVYISASNDRMPQMIQGDGSAVDPMNTMACQQIARSLYGGCYINAAVKPWLQDNKHGRGIRCDLVAVQFFADGEAFGEGAADASGMFGQVGNAPTAAGDAPTAPAAPASGMPAAPFPGTPGMPDFMGGGQ